MEPKLIHWEKLLDFSKRALMKLGVAEKDAWMVADNLVSSNLRGIDSHGVSRLARYVDGVKSGYIIANAKPKIVKESSVLANVDGGNGLGQVMGTYAMELAIQKTQKEGFGMVTVFNSNHYGYAGYYPLMALKHDFMGVSMTNSAPLAVPTFGKNAIIGTNPIAVTAPTKRNKPWVMDFATTTVPRGKLEVYNRLNKTLPDGWATDETGNVSNDPARVLKNLNNLLGGGLLPLGGAGELFGGHKGYGLTVMVDVFCAVLSGSNYGPHLVSKKEGNVVHPRIGHFFMALDPEYFVGKEEFKNTMDAYIDELKNSEKAAGQDRIYVHGEKEFEMQEKREKEGLPLDAKTVESLMGIATEYNEPIEFMN
ncbi:MAG: Ldh family oxidoreductase [bacterium]|nr:MAG: Ldh family oxidoreductase [bacterium]